MPKLNDWVSSAHQATKEPGAACASCSRSDEVAASPSLTPPVNWPAEPSYEGLPSLPVMFTSAGAPKVKSLMLMLIADAGPARANAPSNGKHFLSMKDLFVRRPEIRLHAVGKCRVCPSRRRGYLGAGGR